MNNQQFPIFIAGPFRQLLTMDHLSLKGSLKDAQLEIIEKAGVVHQNGLILEIGLFEELCTKYNSAHPEIQYIESDMIALPGLVDAHTHLCWAGSRENEYAMRLEGRSYTEIARSGGGIWDTVTKTRNATDDELKKLLKTRADRLLANGITTCEVKSGYELTLEGEIRLLEIIRSANQEHSIDLVSTCLAAHIKPKDFDGGTGAYLQFLADKLLPVIKKEGLTNRIDIFVEEGAFGVQEAEKYLSEAKKMGFDLVVHGEQFTSGGVSLAVKVGAKSVDHLEVIGVKAIAELAASEVVAMALPGASIGLGCRFAPARKLLDAGCCLAIGSDWNPGSAPMGDLLAANSHPGYFRKTIQCRTVVGLHLPGCACIESERQGNPEKGKFGRFHWLPR